MSDTEKNDDGELKTFKIKANIQETSISNKKK